AAMERLPVRNTKWAPPRSPLIDRNRGSDAEQIGQTQDTGHLRARIMHDANFVCSACGHCVVPPGQILTLPAIEASEDTEQLNGITEYCHRSRLGPDCRQVDARTVHPLSLRLDCRRHEWGNCNGQGIERNPRTWSMGRRLFVVESDTAPA